MDFGTHVRKHNVKNLMESDMKLGFWDNVRKYNGKKLIEIKLGLWDNVRK